MRIQAGYPTRSGMSQLQRKMKFFAVGTGLLALLLVVFDSVCSADCGYKSTFLAATVGLAVLTGLPAWIAFQLITRDPVALWTPAVAYLLGTMLFFGFGNASTLFSDPSTRSYLLAGNYGLDATGLIRTQIMTATGITVAVVSMVLCMRLRFGAPTSARTAAGTRRQLSLPATATFFIALGLLLKYGLVLPARYGTISFTVPGALVSMVHLADLGLAAAMYLAVRGSRLWLLVFVLVWVPHLAFSLLEFSKKTMMLAILLPALGAFLAHQRWTRLVPWVAFAALTFSFLQDVNTTARLSFLQERGTFRAADFSDRASMLSRVLAGEVTLAEVSSAARDEAQVAWLRLNYAGAQLRAMELYDNGRPGEWTLTSAALVPRFLWGDKDATNLRGRTFNQIVTGNPDAATRVGITVYADGYWTMGWPGVILFSAIMGGILGVLTRLTYRYVSSRQLIYFPVVFLGIQSGALGVMGFLQSSFVASIPIIVGYLLLIYLTEMIVGSLKRPTTRYSHKLGAYS
jgi:hypothetical protein